MPTLSSLAFFPPVKTVENIGQILLMDPLTVIGCRYFGENWIVFIFNADDALLWGMLNMVFQYIDQCFGRPVYTPASSRLKCLR